MGLFWQIHCEEIEGIQCDMNWTVFVVELLEK